MIELDGAGGPTGHVSRKQFEQGKCSLAAATADGIRYLAARDQNSVALYSFERGGRSRLSRFGDRAVPDKVGNIGHDPIFTRLDEPVFVELRDVIFDDVDLLGDHAE